jgi:hypothetical protein
LDLRNGFYIAAGCLTAAYAALCVVTLFTSGIALAALGLLLFVGVFVCFKLVLDRRFDFRRADAYIVLILCAGVLARAAAVLLDGRDSLDAVWGAASAVRLAAGVLRGIVMIMAGIALRRARVGFPMLPGLLSPAFIAAGAVWTAQMIVPYTVLFSKDVMMYGTLILSWAGAALAAALYVAMAVMFFKLPAAGGPARE